MSPLFFCLPELHDNVASSPILHVLGLVQEFLHLQLWLIYMRCFSNLQIHYHRHGHTILLLYRKAVLLGYMFLYPLDHLPIKFNSSSSTAPPKMLIISAIAYGVILTQRRCVRAAYIKHIAPRVICVFCQNGSVDAAYLRYIALQVLYKIILRAIRIKIIPIAIRNSRNLL